MNSKNLKFRLKELLFAIFAVVGIFSFSGVEIGSPARVLETESIELLVSKKERDNRLFDLKNIQKRVSSFSKKENFKHLSFLQEQTDKIRITQFSKKEIPIRFFIKKFTFPASSKTTDEFLFASIHG